MARKRLAAGFGISLGLMVTIVFAVHINARQMIQARLWVAHTNQVLATMAQFSESLDDIRRGGDDAFRQSQQRLKELQDLTQDNPHQQQRLLQLEQLLQEGVHRHPASIHRLLSGMADEEDVLLHIREERSMHAVQHTVWTIWISILLSCIILFLVFSALLKEIAEHAESKIAREKIEQRFRLLVQEVQDYAIFMLDPDGYVVSWNDGAQRLKQYTAQEIIGQSFTRFYTPEDLAQGKPQAMLKEAREKGRVEYEGWRIRKDGTRFWADVVLSAIHDSRGELIGFSKVTRDMTERRVIEDNIRRLNQDLQRQTLELTAANKELEAFSYSVSHDLRAPLRGIDGFSRIVLETQADKLDAEALQNLRRVRSASQRMGVLIDDLLTLARLSRTDMRWESVNLSQIAEEICKELQTREPKRMVEFRIAPGLKVMGDPRLLSVALDNLLGNAWKFTSRHEKALIEVGTMGEEHGSKIYFVRDDGAGFDMAYANKLFNAFQRLHNHTEFPGTGVGLAIAHRVIFRHGGKIWAESQVEKGATFFFTLGESIRR